MCHSYKKDSEENGNDPCRRGSNVSVPDGRQGRGRVHPHPADYGELYSFRRMAGLKRGVSDYLFVQMFLHRQGKVDNKKCRPESAGVKNKRAGASL